MKIFKTIVIGSETGSLDGMDTIEHEGKLWLVPHWLDVPARGVTKPGRIIRLDTLPHQKMRPPYRADFVLNYPLPKELLGRQSPTKPIPGVEFQELPEIELPMIRKGN